MVIQQGDVFWVDLEAPSGSGPGYRQPYVVIQKDTFNRSKISTTVICIISSNLNLARSPGNVLLSEGEANLSKQSVVNISQLFTVDKQTLRERSGVLSQRNLQRVLNGIRFLIEPD
jgi:mRNA interferase MazF